MKDYLTLYFPIFVISMAIYAALMIGLFALSNYMEDKNDKIALKINSILKGFCYVGFITLTIIVGYMFAFAIYDKYLASASN